MIVRIQSPGKSFFGAALYYLHDKKAKHELLRLSDERVAWTATHNTASNVPEIAIQEMIAIAQFQDELKRESGQSLGGRECENPVMTIALSWHPAEKPTKDQMQQTAHSFLEHMGWQDHQALLLAHNDTAHQHVHIVLNRIHPFTGLVHDDHNSFHRSERWRAEYTREHSHEFQPHQRGHTPYEHAVNIRDGAARYAQLEAVATQSLERQERDQLAHHHQQEREAFLDSRHAQFREVRQQAYREVRQEYRQRWTDHYAKTEHTRVTAKQLQRDTAEPRAIHFAGQGDFPAAWNAVGDRDAASRALRIEIYKERQALRSEQREETRERQDDACTELYTQRADAFTAIKLRQKDERAELKELQTARDAGEPFNQPRLAELLSEAPAQDRAQPLQEQGREAKQPITPDIAAQAAERDDRADAAPGERAPRQDAFDGLAGGIGKLAEIASDILGGIFAPPTPQEQAIERAKAAAREEAQPEREATAAKATDDRARSTEAQIRTYFEEHADRIRDEDEADRAKKRRTRER